MHASGVKAVLGQRFEQDINVFFAVTEHKSVSDIFLTDQVAQGFALVHVVKNKKLVFHRGRHGRGRGDGDFLWIGQEFVRKASDFLGHGRREEKRLTLFWQHVDDFFDVGDEAHVEHAVGFVDHEKFAIRQKQFAAFKRIDQASWRRDDDICAFFQDFALFRCGFTADDQGLRQRHVFAIGVEVCCNLGRKFAGRFENDRPWHPHACAPVMQNIKHRQGEACCLTRPGLCTAQNVTCHKHRRNCLCLNGGRGVVAGVCDGFEDIFAQTEIGEIHMVRFPAMICVEVKEVL